MEKELCLKFLVHLHQYSTTMLRKPHIEAQDLGYINNEVEVFRKRLDKEAAKAYDPAGALDAIGKIPEESHADKARYLSKFLLKHKFGWLSILMPGKDDAHVQREAKILEFRETVKKVLALIEYAS
jgi:hypothetical protein